MEGYHTGRISSIDAKSGYVKVTYPAQNNIVSDWLPLLASEYNMPEIGAIVATILDKNLNGVCLGKIYSNTQTPAVHKGYEKNINGVSVTESDGAFTVTFPDGGSIRYSDGIMTLTADKIVLNGYTPYEVTK